VLNLVKNWGASFIIHSGDFEYDNDPQLFEDNLNAVLGPDYPYFASIGNHDLLAWNGHSQRLTARLQRFGGNLNCTGEIGVNMACNWNGIFFVLSGVGTRGNGHEEYMDNAFASSSAVWKVASWHKNQRLMQIGGKFDETGWEIYDTARKHGAIITTGHEHSYCRSFMMADFESQVVANFDATLELTPGETFAFVSGLGGKEVRDWNERLISNEWWAAYGASDNNIQYGALLCTFNINGDLRKAHCTFTDINGKVWDDFDISSALPDNKAELKKALQTQEERKQAHCKKTEWIEVPISRSNGDVHEDAETGILTCKSKTHSFVSKAAVALHFEGVPVMKGARVLHAYLQVYGAEADQVLPHFVISGAKGTLPATCGRHARRHQLAAARTTRTEVVWEEEEEEWEIQNVWVSPDLKDIVTELTSDSTWEQGDSITLNMVGQGNRAFHSFDDSPCLAPTLAIEIENDC